MKFTEITISTTTQSSEIVAYFLQEISVEGVSIFDPMDLNISSWDYVDESLKNQNSTEVLVKGYCHIEDTEGVLSFLHQQLKNLDKTTSGSLEITLNEVSDDSWIALWKQTFQPLNIGDFVICPEWLDAPKLTKNQKLLMLESGVAFGTGRHETTSSVLKMLSKIDLKCKTVVDIGCGSGILGLCALLNGAKSAVLIDNDSQATEISTYNAKINNLLDQNSDSLKIITGNLADKVEEKFDIVLANLTAEILQILANDISKITKNGSILLLSGILADRAEKIKDLYTQKGFYLIEEMPDGEWVTLKLGC